MVGGEERGDKGGEKKDGKESKVQFSRVELRTRSAF
jgi:hypothetical protein